MSDTDFTVDESLLGFEPAIPTGRARIERAKFTCPKKIKLPLGFVYAIDTNELIPQHHGYEELLPHKKRSVHAGDYSLNSPSGADLDHYVCVERKAAGDIIGCVASGRDRFERSLERLKACKRPAIVVECDLKGLYNKKHYSKGSKGEVKTHPNSVVGSILAWSSRNRIPVWFAHDRATAIELTKWFLNLAAKDWKDERRD